MTTISPAFVYGYRYGFNGMEKDEEVKGGGNSINYKYRMHDPRLGRFFAEDPLSAKYPFYSPYSFSGNRVIDMVDLEGLEPASPEMKEKALNALKEFGTEIRSVKWTYISRQMFIQSATNVIQNPKVIDQQGTPLCGVASALYVMAQYDPESYARMAIELYRDGETKSINGLFSKTIEVNPELTKTRPTNGLSHVDYIMLTSIKHSYNLTGYNPSTDNEFYGITVYGEIVSLLEKFSNLKEVTNQYGYNYDAVQKALVDQAAVILLVDYDHFRTGKPSSDVLQKAMGNHYIVVNSISIKGDNVTVNYWTWGDTTKKQSSTTISKDVYQESVKNHLIFNRNDKE